MGLQTFKSYLEERFVNAILDDPKKEQYVDQVWDIIQKSYSAIGGIKTNGFQSKEKMMTLPMWKMAVQDGKVVAVVIYKDKGGRKSVAMGTDGSEMGKKRVVDMVKNDLKRSYGEKSKAALGTLMKTVPEDVVKQFLIKPADVAKLSGDDEIIPIKGYKGELPKDAQMTLKKYPFLKDYGYLKDFGGTMLFKVMFGTPGKSIR